MNPDRAYHEIVSGVRVTRQSITVSKSYILSNFNNSSTKMLRRMLEHFEAQQPEKIVLHESIDPFPQIKQVANSLSWQLAFAEAIWGLIGASILIPIRKEYVELEIHQSWTTVVPGSSGRSSGWNFEEFRTVFPSGLRVAPSVEFEGKEYLSDADLYLHHLNIPSIDSQVERALREAVSCFRHELYLPSLAMLGLASEGAWIELGLALLSSCTMISGITKTTRQNKRGILKESYTSIKKKIELVVELYSRKDVFDRVMKESGFGHRDLLQVLNWSTVIRDARNGIHYGAAPSTPNNYEKVATLLLGAAQNFQIIYAIKAAATKF